MRPPCPSRHHRRSRGPNAPPIRPSRPKRRQPMSSCCNPAAPCPSQTLRQPRRHYAAPASSDDAQIAPADKDLRWLAQVTAPSDGLTARQNRRPCNAICLARSTRALSAEAPSGAPRALGQGLNPMNRLAAAIVIGANAACRGGEREDLGTKREWCPVSLVVSATPRRSVRTETLI
jgi:hypothetical protein